MPPNKKNRRRPAKKQHSLKKRLLLPAGIVFLVLASLGAAFYFVFLRTAPPPEITAAGKGPPQEKIFPPPLPAPVSDPFARKEASPAGVPQVAIVIDDMGIQRELCEQLLALNLDLTFSFLPYGPHAPAMAQTAQRLGRDVLLHLPMEPENTERWDPGPGALYLSMPTAALRMHLEKNLSLVPMAVGVNNHMGSRFTTDRKAMRTVLAQLRARGLFFLDSLTTSDSVGYQLASEMGIPTRRRDIFLDNVQEQMAVEDQLEALIRTARKKGTAVAIGHPHPATVAALVAYRQRLRTAVQVVALHELVGDR